MNHKPHDPVEHQAHDKIGKSILIQFLKQAGWEILAENKAEDDLSGKCPNWDIEAKHPEKGMHRFDAEHRTNWKYGRKEFPYYTVHVPARKRKDSYNTCSFFVSASLDGLGIAIVHRSDVLAANVVSGPVRNYDNEDDFADIPINQSQFFYLNKEGFWNRK